MVFKNFVLYSPDPPSTFTEGLGTRLIKTQPQNTQDYCEFFCKCLLCLLWHCLYNAQKNARIIYLGLVTTITTKELSLLVTTNWLLDPSLTNVQSLCGHQDQGYHSSKDLASQMCMSTWRNMMAIGAMEC